MRFHYLGIVTQAAVPVRSYILSTAAQSESNTSRGMRERAQIGFIDFFGSYSGSRSGGDDGAGCGHDRSGSAVEVTDGSG